MFVKFTIQNFGSFSETQELSMVAANQRENPESLIQVKHPAGALVRVAGIYGANASGKSNLLKALHFFQLAVRSSQNQWEPEAPIPIKQFAFDDSNSQSTRLSLDFIVDDIRHEYGFTLDEHKFLSEWLHVYPLGRKQVWFERNGNEIKFGSELSDAHFRSKNNAVKEVVRPNSLLLSAAAQSNYEKLAPIYNYLRKDWISVLGGRDSLARRTATRTLANASLKEKITQLLKSADLGLLGYEVIEEEMDSEVQKVVMAMFSALPEPQDTGLPKGPFKLPKISFFHETDTGARVALPSSDESSGTLAFFGILGPICAALQHGRLIYIDEIEASLHPNLAETIIRLFTDPKTNPHNAQLIFTTHEVALLTGSTLRRDQIWFTEKSTRGATQLFPLTDFHLRKDEKIGKGYVQGRFGGIPNLDFEQISLIFERQGANSHEGDESSEESEN